MQVSVKWISELVPIDLINLNDLIEKLTLGGFEVEELIKIEVENKTQLALDISATANRSDSLSIQGLSTEIAALLNRSIVFSKYTINDFHWKNRFNNDLRILSNNQYCSNFVTVIIKNIQNFKTPKWIKQKLINSGINPEDNINDFQHYILLETGYPFVVYDFDKICLSLKSSNFELSFQNATENETFLASNKTNYNLNSNSILLKANNLPISIAGIIENNYYSCSESTKSLLIEGSVFNAAKIRQQSRVLGLRTDRSSRYEKSIKGTYLIEALYRFISLLRISNIDLICEEHTFAEIDKFKAIPILLKYQTINEILGPINQDNLKIKNYLSPEIISNYLTRLNFIFSYNNNDFTWEIEIPDTRSEDIIDEIDLIEEIGRLHGFNNFLTILPKIKVIGVEDFTYKTRKKLTSCFLNLGLTELINYSLVNQKTIVTNQVQLINPLVSDCSYLRTSLLPNLLMTVQENLKQSNSLIEGFEYGHVFSGELETNFKEKEYVAGIFGGIKKKLTWSESDQLLTWFEGKGKIEQLFLQLNLSTYWKNSFSLSDGNPIFHSYRSATIYLKNGKKLGTFGQIHPLIANKLEIPTEIYLFEFDIEVIKNQIQTNKLSIYQGYSSYPKIIKNLSFVIKETILFEQLEKVLYANGTEFLSEVNLLDEYRGISIPEKHISLCVQFIFQSKEKTLETKNIENIIKNLESILINKFDALIRN